MKYIILTLGILILESCGNSNEKNLIPTFQENELSFLHLRFGYDKSNDWIKNPENLNMVHETFKKIGYETLLSQGQWEDYWNWWLDVKNSPENLIDSLEITYNEYEESPKYYQEFWQRRIKEGNDKVAYKIVSEIKQIMLDRKQLEFDSESVNDTLFKLMTFEYPERDLSNGKSNRLLNYLIEIGLHESAYNIVSGENGKFEKTIWEKDKSATIKLLKESTKYQRPWYQDDTK